jgi:hypothetical protein
MVGAVSDEPATVLDAVRLLDAEGFGTSFSLTPEGLKCGGCGKAESIERAEVLRVYRFEGPSDPDEEAVVYGLRCPACDVLGTLVSSFGPGSDPELADRLVMLDTRFDGD